MGPYQVSLLQQIRVCSKIFGNKHCSYSEGPLYLWNFFFLTSPVRHTLQPIRTIFLRGGWLGDAMVLGKLPVPGRPTNLKYSRARAYCAVGAGRGCLVIFSLVYHFSFLSPSLWETALYRLKYCLKGLLSPKQPTNYLLKAVKELTTQLSFMAI